MNEDQKLQHEHRLNQIVEATFPAFDLACQYGGTSKMLHKLAEKMEKESHTNDGGVYIVMAQHANMILRMADELSAEGL